MTKLGGKWYPALQEVEIDVSEQKKFLEAGALLVAEYMFIDEEVAEEPKEEVQEEEVEEVKEPEAEKPKAKEEPKKPAPKKNAKKK